VSNQFDTDRLPAVPEGHGERGAAAGERIEDGAAFRRTGQDARLDQFLGEGRIVLAAKRLYRDRPDRPLIATLGVEERPALRLLTAPETIALPNLMLTSPA